MCLLLQGTGRPGVPLYRSIRAFVRDARHNQLLAIPAALYAVNNYLKFAMQLYFKPTTAKMLGNLKVPSGFHVYKTARSRCSPSLTTLRDTLTANAHVCEILSKSDLQVCSYCLLCHTSTMFNS